MTDRNVIMVNDSKVVHVHNWSLPTHLIRACANVTPSKRRIHIEHGYGVHQPQSARFIDDYSSFPQVSDLV